jgi:eukaryotic-like serine/threonine-protein kinase
MQQLGEYLVHRLIGEGGMGKVFEAEERLSRRRVALKVLRDDLAQSEDGRRRFLREMTILSHLDHPNVVRCLACTEAGGHLVMVLEYLHGYTLREVLRARVCLPWSEAVRIATDIASGLGAVHAHNPPIVHRDLKPENVMISTDGRTKVMDFGVAKMLDAVGAQTLNTVGTFQYMSPEQIQGYAVDPRADLYCLGLLLYEMLCGRPPFTSRSAPQLLQLHCTQAPPPLPREVSISLPPGLEALLFELLAKRPAERPPHAGIVRARLEALGTSAIHPTPSSMREHPPPAATHETPHPSSGGTLMLIERASAAHARGRTIHLVVASVAAILLITAAATYYVWSRSSRAETEEPTVVPTVVPTEPTSTRPERSEPVDDRTEESVEAVRERAQRDREEANANLPPDRTDDSDEDDGDSDAGTNDGGGSSGSGSDGDPGFFGRLRPR